MALNITKITNVEPYSVNESIINNSDLINTAISTTQSTTGEYFALGVLLFLYAFLFIKFVWEGGTFRLDVLQAHIAASGVCIIMSTLMLLIGLSQSIFTLSMFVVFFFIGLVAMMLSRK